MKQVEYFIREVVETRGQHDLLILTVSVYMPVMNLYKQPKLDRDAWISLS